MTSYEFEKAAKNAVKPVKTTWQRIVGFLTPEQTYSKERKAEFAMRDWFEMDRMREIG